MVDSNSKVMAVANTQVKKNASFSIVAGVLFVAMGFFMGLLSGQPMAILFGGLGLLFIFRGISGYARSSKYPSAEAENPKDRFGR
jgi:predicted phage tail protein